MLKLKYIVCRAHCYKHDNDCLISHSISDGNLQPRTIQFNRLIKQLRGSPIGSLDLLKIAVQRLSIKAQNQ